MKIIRRHFAITLLIFSTKAWAGGDYVQGMVKEFSENHGNYSFTFVQTDSRKGWPLIPNCPEIKMAVSYARAHWADWLPFVGSSHPTRQQTIEAATALAEAAKQRKNIGFGYMGKGLAATKVACSFTSKGLQLYEGAVISYNNPV